MMMMASSGQWGLKEGASLAIPIGYQAAGKEE
jgi:hypothetical protein